MWDKDLASSTDFPSSHVVITLPAAIEATHPYVSNPVRKMIPFETERKTLMNGPASGFPDSPVTVVPTEHSRGGEIGHSMERGGIEVPRETQANLWTEMRRFWYQGGT